MTYQLATYYCTRCRSATPHELDGTGQKSYCLTCREKRLTPTPFRNGPAATAQHFAALDGAGNRGEEIPTKLLLEQKAREPR